jgi:hypothetical protein
VFTAIGMQKLVNFRHREGHCFEFQICKIENLEKNRNVAGPACQWPMTAHGHVFWPMTAHVRMATPRWLGHRPPPHTGTVNCTPPSLHEQPMQLPPPHACHALIPRSSHAEICSPPLPRQLPSFRPTLLYLSLCSSISSAEHHCWELLLPPRAPLCHHRLGFRSPNRPPLGANRMPPLTSFPSDQAAPPAAKDLHDVSLRRSSFGLISAVLSTTRTADSFPTQQPPPTTADRPLHAVPLRPTKRHRGGLLSVSPNLPNSSNLVSPAPVSLLTPFPYLRGWAASLGWASPLTWLGWKPAARFGPVQQCFVPTSSHLYLNNSNNIQTFRNL